MLKKILLVLLAAIAAMLLYAATKPDTFHVMRKTMIAAPPEKIYPMINDFHHWSEWSPWEKLDPAMTRTFEGPESGTGAIYAWRGNQDVGEGRMEIVDSTAPEKIVIKLDFIAPIEGHNTAEFVLRHAPSGKTEVIWLMHGPSPYMTKVMDTLIGMDRMIGKDFETGLANMKTIAER
jgi:uncharacterized protein YndB with AHSA1/START domain